MNIFLLPTDLSMEKKLPTKNKYVCYADGKIPSVKLLNFVVKYHGFEPR
jgi:hypothetical protein